MRQYRELDADVQFVQSEKSNFSIGNGREVWIRTDSDMINPNHIGVVKGERISSPYVFLIYVGDGNVPGKL